MRICGGNGGEIILTIMIYEQEFDIRPRENKHLL